MNAQESVVIAQSRLSDRDNNGGLRYALNRQRFVFALAIALLCTAEGNASAQTGAPVPADTVPRIAVHGTICSRTTHGGAQGSVLLSDSQRVSTDANGHFRALVAVGTMMFRIRAVGFAPLDTQIAVSSANHDFEFLLTRGPVTLDRVETTAMTNKPARYANTTKYDEFYERRYSAIGGTFLTREDVERFGALEVADLLRGISGVKIERDRFGLPTVVLNRCKTAIEKRPAPEKTVQVFVDGKKTFDAFDTLQMLKAGDVEAMEVYAGVASLPIAARGD